MFLEGDSGAKVSPAPTLVLASTSPYRRELLTRLRVPFETYSPAVDELPVAGELPMDRALRLALEKALSVAARHPQGLVIGSDQVAASGNGVLDKPGDAPRCRAQLARLSGQTARFYTACAVIGLEQAVRQVHLDTTVVVFRTLYGGGDRALRRARPALRLRGRLQGGASRDRAAREYR